MVAYLGLVRVQVAGHFEDDVPTMMQTKDGHVLKPLATDGRGARELEFYQCAEQARTLLSNSTNYKRQPYSMPAIDQTLTSSLMRVKGCHSLAVEHLKKIVSYFPQCCMLLSTNLVCMPL